MALLSSNLATNSRFTVPDFLSDIGENVKRVTCKSGYLVKIPRFICNPFGILPMSERKSETAKRDFVARLLLRSVIRICLGRQEGPVHLSKFQMDKLLN